MVDVLKLGWRWVRMEEGGMQEVIAIFQVKFDVDMDSGVISKIVDIC